MRNDREFLQKMIVPFLKELFLDAKASGEPFYKYFSTNIGNKTVFKKEEKFHKYVHGTNTIFDSKEDHNQKWEQMIDIVFSRMQKDFHYGLHTLYMPDDEGNFTKKQELAIYNLATSITDKLNKPAIAGEKEDEHEKIVLQTSKRLQEVGRFKIVKELKFDSQTGMIEGVVRNINDPEGKLLKIKIDPNEPELISFSDEKDQWSFTTENSDRSIGLFNSRNSNDVMRTNAHTNMHTNVPANVRTSEPKARTMEPASKALNALEALDAVNALDMVNGGTGEDSTETYDEETEGEETGTRPSMPHIFKRKTAQPKPQPKVRVTEENIKQYEKEQESKRGKLPQQQAQQQQQQPQADAAQNEQMQQQQKPRNQIENYEPEQPKKSGKGKAILGYLTGGAVGVGGLITGLITTDII